MACSRAIAIDAPRRVEERRGGAPGARAPAGAGGRRRQPPARSARPEAPEPERIALGPAIVAPRPFEPTQLAGRWEGRYQCQGEAVGMALEVQPPQGDRVAARFEFFAAEGAPSFPTGSFRVDGVFEVDSRRLRLTGRRLDRAPVGLPAP